ncbi:hypothetical protein SLS58_003442 [Diplodia intermedia]|uniref:Uncharacterized protein n=1 Tax=Diplodia intermedia TaxID=856260 RepID=A0ABR3TW33_9PEZI
MDETQQEKTTDVLQPLPISKTTNETTSTKSKRKEPRDILHEILIDCKLAVKRKTLEHLTGLGSQECSDLIGEFEFYDGLMDDVEGSDKSTFEAMLEVAVISYRQYGHELNKHTSIKFMMRSEIQLGAIYLAAKERGFTGTIWEYFAEQYLVDEKGSHQSHEDKDKEVESSVDDGGEMELDADTGHDENEEESPANMMEQSSQLTNETHAHHVEDTVTHAPLGHLDPFKRMLWADLRQRCRKTGKKFRDMELYKMLVADLLEEQGGAANSGIGETED